ncbi:MAG: MBL fold metallo-hydrolase [Methanophagales archaeon ANME-1-THS]|nr:MAG: MBL fold metallo-hydrolase [Methanophagales archaeon ANME-1-THS]
MNALNVREVDKLEVTVLVDNYTDVLLLQSTEVVKRSGTPPPNLPLAEHGLACLLKVKAGSEEHVVLMDAGVSPTCLFHNADVLKIDLSKVESVVLSHGHYDHFGALVEFLNNAPKGIPLILHPDAFYERRLNVPRIGVAGLPTLDEIALKKTGVTLRKAREASLLVSNLILVSGEVERVTDFEKGFPWAEAKIDDKWVVDPFHDDQGVAVKVKNKGLVVISGCSHAGIINTVKYLQKVARTNKVHAVLGGFHLTGPIFEPIVGPTIQEMKRIGPDFVVPMHCTGWKAINQFAQEMPEQFLLNSVGTTYVFQ